MFKSICVLFLFYHFRATYAVYNVTIDANNYCFDNKKCYLADSVPGMPTNNGLKLNVSTNTGNIFDLWSKFAIFSLENATSVKQKCSLAVKRLAVNVRSNDFDALKMFDATGKLPSGILRGNVNQFGDFDECLSVEYAQYCLAEIDLEPAWQKSLSSLRDLVHSHYAIQETFDDVKHRVPGFTMIRWGFCIPSDCNAEDLENGISEIAGLSSRIRQEMCQKSQKAPTDLSVGDVVTRSIFLILILFTVVATFRHRFATNMQIPFPGIFTKMLDCFDVQINWASLKTVKGEMRNEIPILHGVRALSAFALLMSHKVMALFYNPYMNRSIMTANLGMGWSVIGRTAILYTDCFMLVSGLLNANSLLSELERTKSMSLKNKFTSRIFRISPNIIAVILFCTYILPSLGSGPLWPLVVEHHSHLCKQHMWRNMLYIHNYFPFEDMCLTHTHQVGIDMQLFLLTPVVIYLLWRSKRIGLYIIAGLATASTIARFWITWEHNLSHVVHFGIPISRMFDTANFSYILPTHRATIYLLGVFLAYLLKNKSTPVFSKLQATILWTVFMAFGYIAWLGPVHMSRRGYVYNKVDAAFYAAFSPIFWGGAVAWTIYATQTGYGGFFGNFLSWGKFEYFTKISYAVYLVQFPLFFYNVGLTRHVDEFKPYHMMQIPETLFIILISILLTLLVEIPFQNLRKVIFEREPTKQSDPTKSDSNRNVLLRRRAKLG